MADTQSTRDRILETAIALLDTEGEGSLRIDQVADIAHVSKQSLYNFFGDREGLIVAAHAEQYRRILAGFDQLKDNLLECVTADDYARLVLGVAAAGVREGALRRRLRVQALGAAATRPELAQAIRVAHRSSTAELEKVAKFGQIRGWVTDEYPASSLSEFWFSLVTGFHLAENYADPSDVTPTGNAVVDALSLLLFGRTYPEYSTGRPAEN